MHLSFFKEFSILLSVCLFPLRIYYIIMCFLIFYLHLCPFLSNICSFVWRANGADEKTNLKHPHIIIKRLLFNTLYFTFNINHYLKMFYCCIYLSISANFTLTIFSLSKLTNMNVSKETRINSWKKWNKNFNLPLNLKNLALVTGG